MGISFYVPIRNSDQAVAVNVDHLPEDVDELLGIMQAELAPIGLWLDFAKAYLQRGKEEQFVAMLESGCSPGERAYTSIETAHPDDDDGAVASRERRTTRRTERPTQTAEGPTLTYVLFLPVGLRVERCRSDSWKMAVRSDVFRPDLLPPRPQQRLRSTTPTLNTSARASCARSPRTTSTSAAWRRTESGARSSSTAPRVC